MRMVLLDLVKESHQELLGTAYVQETVRPPGVRFWSEIATMAAPTVQLRNPTVQHLN